MAIDINTIITNFQPLYPANKQQIWSRLKDDNPSLTDEIITHLLLSIEENKISISVSPTTTEYEGEINHLSYQYNLWVQIDGTGYFVYDFNQFCHTGETFNVRTNVGDKTFTTNSEFTTFDFIQNPSINFIGDGFLSNCVNINSSISIPSGITSIGNFFLSRCSSFNQTLTLPNSLTSIGNSFLGNCSSFNRSLTLHNSLTSIGNYFLSHCTSFNRAVSLPNSLISIGNNFLDSCENFNQPLILPNSLTSIGNSFLSDCYSFNQTLILSNSLTSIGNYFLATPLTNKSMLFNQPLTLPNSLTSIGNYFLSHCTSFDQELTLPVSLTSIGIYFMYCCNNFSQKLTISDSITPQMFASSSSSFATSNSSATVYTEGFKVKYDKFSQLKERFPNSNTNPYRNIVVVQTSFIAKETSLSYKYHLNLVLGEHDIKVYLVKENEVSMKFDKPITTILPDTSTGKLLIGNALKNLPADQLTETAIETKITAINFYNK